MRGSARSPSCGSERAFLLACTVVWELIGGMAAGAAYLAGRRLFRHSYQDAAARAAGLQKANDLTHVPEALQRTALWAISEGGFERRIVHGVLARKGGDVELTAFDLETLRERRGEWAYLPVEPPFRIGGLVSVVVCEVERSFPHVLLKRAGRGDELADDTRVERMTSLPKQVRDGLGIKRSYESELPETLPRAAHLGALPEHWRAYTRAPELLDAMLAAGLHGVLAAASRRDLAIELLDRVVVVYPAARDVAGADAFADLTTDALALVDGVLAVTPQVSPRGLESQRT